MSDDPLLWVKRRKAVAGALALFASIDEFTYLQVIAGVGANPPPRPSFWIAAYATGLSTLLLWSGCAAFYALAKGRSPWWGLAGLLTCCGVAPLLFLPSLWPEEKATEYLPGDYPRPRQKH